MVTSASKTCASFFLLQSGKTGPETLGLALLEAGVAEGLAKGQVLVSQEIKSPRDGFQGSTEVTGGRLSERRRTLGTVPSGQQERKQTGKEREAVSGAAPGTHRNCNG